VSGLTTVETHSGVVVVVVVVGSDLVLTVYFGTPNMFITLWLGFDYGTNLPLGTLII
jgi:hypothetical protein